jgi:hypothetical protein
MTNTINEQGPGRVSRHCADHCVTNVLDISQRNIPRARRNDFMNNANNRDGVRMLNENNVFHIEVNQD